MSTRFDPARLSITAAIAGTLIVSGCGREPEVGTASTDVRVCRDADGVRVDDAKCDTQQVRSGGGSSGAMMAGLFAYHYFSRGQRVPGIGNRITGGQGFATPGVAYGRATPATVTRGGFGQSARATGSSSVRAGG